MTRNMVIKLDGKIIGTVESIEIDLKGITLSIKKKKKSWKVS